LALGPGPNHDGKSEESVKNFFTSCISRQALRIKLHAPRAEYDMSGDNGIEFRRTDKLIMGSSQVYCSPVGLRVYAEKSGLSMHRTSRDDRKGVGEKSANIPPEYDAVRQVATNPLCDLHAPLVSPAFDTRVRAAARKYF
jgi:hypothetical protein